METSAPVHAAADAQAPILLKERDEISFRAGRSSQQGAERFLGFCHPMEKQMTKMTFVSAALIAATVFATQAMGARNGSAARHAATKDGVRAPNVGAFALERYQR